MSTSLSFTYVTLFFFTSCSGQRDYNQVIMYFTQVDTLLYFMTYCVIYDSLSLTGEHWRLKSNNYWSSVYTTIIYNGLLYIYLQVAIYFGHGGHIHATGTFNIACCESVHWTMFTRWVVLKCTARISYNVPLKQGKTDVYWIGLGYAKL
jgi:hypothetical protein